MKTLFAAALTASVAFAGLAATPAMAQDRYGYQGGYDNRDDGRQYRGGGDYREEYRGDYRDGREYRGDRGYRGNRNYRGNQRCGSGTTGAIVGGVLGALVGGEIGRGSGYYNQRSGTGTIIGAGAGALLGREVERSDCGGRGGRHRGYRR